MALSPLRPPEERFVAAEPETQPLKTYRLNLNRGRIERKIDGIQALKQFVRKALITARFRFLIYNDEYGSEIDKLKGESLTADLIENELPRVIKEALITHELITDITNFRYNKEGDKAFISFNVINQLRNFTEEMEVEAVE